MSVQQFSEEEIESFDDSETGVGNEQGAMNDPDKEEGEQGAEKNSKETITQTEQLEDKNDKDDIDEKDKEEDKKDRSNKEDEGKGEDKEDETTEKKEDVKYIKADVDGKSLDVDPSATFTTKVDGKFKSVTMRELLDTHSGHTSLDKRFDDYKSKERAYAKNNEEFSRKQEVITGHLNTISQILDDESKDPMDALYYLLDMAGKEPIQYHKRAINFRQEEFRDLDEMSESEAELYWTKKELASNRRHQQSKVERANAAKTQEENAARVRQSREALGVSEDQFYDAQAELKRLGYKDDEITAQRVSEYAHALPFIQKAEKITDPYQADLEDDDLDALTSEIANTLKSFPHFTEEEALIASAKKVGLEIESDDSDIEAINKKAEIKDATPKRKKYNSKMDSEDDIEEFDQFDDIY